MSDYKLKSVTINQIPSKEYDASILFEYENQVLPQDLHHFLGLDFSMDRLYIDRKGNAAAYSRDSKQTEEKRKREQRKLSELQKGSKNRNK